MTLPKKQKANVTKILDNPVQSKAQEVMRPKKEGFFGWLSYLGWSLMFFPMGNAIIEYFLKVNRKYIDSPDWFPEPLTIIFIGSILTLITMIRYKYIPSNFVLFSWFILAYIVTTVGFMTTLERNVLFENVLLAETTYLFFWTFSLCWYPYYFYKKSKEGYRYVSLKVLLFTFLPFLSFIGAEVEDLSFDITNISGEVFY